MSARHEIKYEFITPASNIESEVPTEQLKREPIQNDENLNEMAGKLSNLTVDSDENKMEVVEENGNTFAPVLTKTRKEVNPLYSEIQSEVVPGPQPLRPAPKLPDSDEDHEDKKPRSRIPKLNFRRAAEKIKRERKHSDDYREPEVPTQRRSSIPKPRRFRTPIAKEKQNNEQNDVKTKELDNKEPETPAEDEFDKIYDEIIHTEGNDQFQTKIPNKIDTEDLEHSFEEIIHDYEENRVKPIDVKAVKSKIPLIKQQSLPEHKFSKKLERRFSLKDDVGSNEVKPTDESVNVNNNKTNNKPRKDENKLDFEEYIAKTQLSDHRDNVIGKPEDSTKHEIKKPDTEKSEEKQEVPPKATIPTYIVDEANEKKIIKETIKIATTNVSETPSINNTIENIDNKEPRETDFEGKPKTDSQIVPPKTPNVPSVDDNKVENKKFLETSFDDIADSSKIHKDDPKSELEAKTVKCEENITKIPTLRGKVSKIINELDSNEQSNNLTPKKDFTNDIPKKNSILSKIYMFSKDSEVHNNNNHANKVNTTENVDKVSKLKDGSTKTNLAKKIRKDSVEKLKFSRTESAPAGKASIDSITPPNTPQIEDVEPDKIDKHQITIQHNKNNEKPEIHTLKTIEISKIVIEDYQKVKYIENDEMIKLETKEAEFAPTNNHKDENDDKNNSHFQTGVTRFESRPESYENHLQNQENAPIEAYNENFGAEAINTNLNEEDLHFKGKVGRIISRIDLINETEDFVKKEAVIEVPIQKSVSSKIALFERQTSKEIRPTLFRKPKKEPVKPKVVDEILKAQPSVLSEAKIRETKHNIPLTDRKQTKSQVLEKEEQNYEQISQEIDKIYEQAVTTVNKLENEVPTDEKDFNKQKETNKYHQEDFTTKSVKKDSIPREAERDIKDVEIKPRPRDLFSKPKEPLSLDERLKQLTTRNEDSRKVKSAAELDLGDAIKGKVRQMIVRMNSIEQLDQLDVKKESSINIKERPRKRSVSEKIALFEKKLTVADEVSSTISSTYPTSGVSTTTSPYTTTTLAPPKWTDDQYKARIEELKDAGSKYGSMNVSMKIRLNNGESMPVIAIGTALMDPLLLPHIISAAIDLGYRAFDTAFIYGNEAAIGEVLVKKIHDGVVKREDLFIIGKLWSTFHRQDLVEQACRDSLAALQIEYFDLYLVHNPMAFKEGGDPLPMVGNQIQYSDVDITETWRGMEGLVDKKLAKSIGVSNFNSEQVAKLVENGRIKPVINQVECHPYLTQANLDEFCSIRDVKLMCFGTLGSKGTPKYLKGATDAVIDDATIRVMAAGLNVSTAQLLLRYQLDSGRAVVVKASSAAHLWDNLQALGFTLTTAQVGILNAMNKNKRTYLFKGMGDTHKEYPFKKDF